MSSCNRFSTTIPGVNREYHNLCEESMEFEAAECMSGCAREQALHLHVVKTKASDLCNACAFWVFAMRCNLLLSLNACQMCVCVCEHVPEVVM